METKEEDKKPWYNFMRTDKFVVFINIVRVLSLFLVAILIYIIVKEVEAVKLLGSDPCKICIEKGATCFMPPRVG